MDPYRDELVRSQARTLVAEVVADGFGYRAATLQWIARRLQRALEDAR